MIGVLIVVILITFVIYSGLNIYIGKRLWDGLVGNLGFVNIKLYWTIFFIIAFSYIIYSLMNRYIKKELILTKIFEFVGSYWFACIVYLLFILVFLDILKLLNKRFSIIKINFINSNFLILGVIIFIIALMFYGTINAKNIQVVKYLSYIKSDKNLDRDYNIVLISDIHIGSFITKEQIKESIGIINKMDPDIVIIAGDIVDNNIEPFEKEGINEEFKKIKSKYGVYGVLGNHDNFGINIQKTINVFEKSNIKLLIDDSDLINNEINIIGRNDKSISRNTNGRAELEALLEKLDEDKINILIDHQPVEYDIAEKKGIDLIVSGHTHGGQFFPIGFITDRIFKNHWGQKRYSNMDSIVSCGLGTWGPPIRIMTKSEIVNIKLKKY